MCASVALLVGTVLVTLEKWWAFSTTTRFPDFVLGRSSNMSMLINSGGPFLGNISKWVDASGAVYVYCNQSTFQHKFRRHLPCVTSFIAFSPCRIFIFHPNDLRVGSHGRGG